jgi:cholesterol transport system auxiliary component
MLSFNVMRYAGRRVWLLMISGGDTALCLHHFTFGPVSQVYLLPVPPAVSVPHAQTVNWSLRVSQPATNQFLNSSRIAVQPQGQEIAVYKNSVGVIRRRFWCAIVLFRRSVAMGESVQSVATMIACRLMWS